MTRKKREEGVVKMKYLNEMISDLAQSHLKYNCGGQKSNKNTIWCDCFMEKRNGDNLFLFLKLI